MKKLLTLLATLGMASAPAMSVAACNGTIDGTSSPIKKAVQDSLDKYTTAYQDYLNIDQYNTKSKDQTWNQKVEIAVFNFLKKSINNFTNFVSISDIKCSTYKPINYGTYQSAQVDISIKNLSFDETINVGDNLLKKVKEFSSYTDTMELKAQDIAISSFLPKSFYDTLPNKGKNWADTKTVNDFLKLFLDPSYEEGFAKLIPTQMPEKDPKTGEWVKDNPVAMQYDKFVKTVSEYFQDKLNFNIDTRVPLPDISTSVATLKESFSFTDIIYALTPDIIHFHNFLNEKMNERGITSLETGSFLSLFITYCLDEIKDYGDDSNNDNFSQIDAADRSDIKLTNNFDVLIYDLFDNWYSGKSRPSYAIIGSTLDSAVNNDGTNTLKIDKRGIKQTITGIPMYGDFELSSPALIHCFENGFTNGIFNSLLTSLIDPKYNPESGLKIKFSIGIKAYSYPFEFSIPFTGVHESEANQSIARFFGFGNNTDGSINTTFNQNSGQFLLEYATDSNQTQWEKMTGKSLSEIANILKTTEVWGFRMRMNNISGAVTVNTGDNTTFTLNKKGFNMNVVI